jgi:ribosomal protein L13E
LSSFRETNGSYDMNKPRPQLGGKPLKHYFADHKPMTEGSLPPSYTKGLTPAQVKAKKAQINRNSKLSDRDPEAYKDMPGDKEARRKGLPQSKYTKAYHARFGESLEELDESALADKAKKSGISIDTLRKVYRRGVAAWNSGHRPGTTPQQWGMARVNSYIAHGKGTYGGADKDLHETSLVEQVKTIMYGEEVLTERGADSKGYFRPTEKGAGLTRKGAKHFGIKTAVTTPPSKLDPKGKAAARRRSFCARMGGMKGTMKDEKGRPTRKAMSLRRWNCEEE